MLGLFAYLQIICVGVVTDPRMYEDDCIATPMCGFNDDPNYACRPCIMLGLLVASVATLIPYGILRRNRAVPQHVNSLYVLYAHADPNAPLSSSDRRGRGKGFLCVTQVCMACP